MSNGAYSSDEIEEFRTQLPKLLTQVRTEIPLAAKRLKEVGYDDEQEGALSVMTGLRVVRRRFFDTKHQATVQQVAVWPVGFIGYPETGPVSFSPTLEALVRWDTVGTQDEVRDQNDQRIDVIYRPVDLNEVWRKPVWQMVGCLEDILEELKRLG